MKFLLLALIFQIDTCFQVTQNPIDVDSSYLDWKIFHDELSQTSEGLPLDITAFYYNYININFKKTILNLFGDQPLVYLYFYSPFLMYTLIYEMESRDLYIINTLYDLPENTYSNDQFKICKLNSPSSLDLKESFDRLSLNNKDFVKTELLGHCEVCPNDFMIIDYRDNFDSCVNRFYISYLTLLDSNYVEGIFKDLDSKEIESLKQELLWLMSIGLESDK